MTVQWEKVHVFISSTFNDMHAERDYLVKQVFPRLQEWCERRKLRLVDIDLRWGVTEADASQNKRVVQVCLERIDACRPFFLCFLGQRRGWVPTRSDISAETYAQYPDLELYAGEASVTELEILHALVTPLHRGKATETAYAPAEHSFFYLRQSDYLTALPQDPPQLRQVYTNEGITDPQERRRADDELARWRNEAIPQTRRPVRHYRARWDPAASTPEIGLPLQCPSTAERGSAAWEAALQRWSSQWAQAGVRVDADGEIGDPAEREKARRFNVRLIQGRLTAFTCEGQPLAEAILADLQAAITARFPEHVETADLTPLQRELDQQAQFLQAASEGFIERQGDFDALDRYIGDTTSRGTFFLTAPGGLGKTSLLARWIDRTQLDLTAGESLHYRFIGGSDGSTTVDALLRSLLTEIQELTGKLESQEIPAEPDRLRVALPALLEAAGARGRTVLVLDGLNQLESGMSDLAWLPLALPPGIKLVASFKRGEPQAEAYLERLRASGQAILAGVRPFDSLDDRRRLVQAYLSQYLKELDESHLEALIRTEGAGNPLYLKIVLAELRVFGAFGALGDKIRSDFGVTPVSAFAALLRRLESDPAYSPVQPKRLVPRVFGWLAHARTGLTAGELADLLVREGLLPDDEAGRERAVEAVYGLLRQVRPYLARREGRADFFYESFEQAVRERYVREQERADVHPESRTARAWHITLVEYFDQKDTDTRRIEELPWQMAQAAEWERLAALLADWLFFELAWNYDRAAVQRYWAQVERNSPIRMTETYQSIIEQHGDKLSYLGSVADLLGYSYHHEEAASLRQYLLEQQRGRTNPLDLAETLNARGISLKNAGDLEGALKAYGEAEAIYRNLGERRNLAAVLANQGNVLRRQGKHTKALAVLEEALQIVRGLDDQYALCLSLNAIALVHHERGDHRKALAFLTEQETLCRAMGEMMGLAAALGNQASILEELWEATPGELAALRREEAAIYRELGIRPKREDALRQLIKHLRRQARVLSRQPLSQDPKMGKELVEIYREEEQICDELHDVAGAAIAQANRAVAMASLGLGEARPLVEQALARAERESQPEVVDLVRQARQRVAALLR